MAMVSTVALLVTPFLYDYDLVLMTVPIAWTASRAHHDGWKPGEKLLLLLCYLAPLGARAAGVILHVPLGPPLALAMLFNLARRAAAR